MRKGDNLHCPLAECPKLWMSVLALAFLNQLATPLLRSQIRARAHHRTISLRHWQLWQSADDRGVKGDRLKRWSLPLVPDDASKRSICGKNAQTQNRDWPQSKFHHRTKTAGSEIDCEQIKPEVNSGHQLRPNPRAVAISGSLPRSIVPTSHLLDR